MPNNEDIFKKTKHISREAHNYNYKQNYHTKSQKNLIFLNIQFLSFTL